MSLSSFESFKSVFKRFPRDTAYVLFYQKIQLQTCASALISAVDQPPLLTKLNGEVKLNVENDNVKFMREKERSNSSTASR